MLSSLPCRPVLPRLKAFSCALLIAVLVPTSILPAQTLETRVVAGAGMDAVMYDGSEYVPGYVGQLGLEMRKAGSRGAFRMSLMHYAQDRSDAYYNFICDGSTQACELKTSDRITGMNVDGSFELARGRIRPYLMSGVGIYRSRRMTDVDRTCLTACQQPYYAWEKPSARTVGSAGFHSGIGIASKLGKTPVFAEMRFMLLANDGIRARGMLPVTFGVKF